MLKCSYADIIQDDIVRDHFVLGRADYDMQRKLYMEHKLDIKPAGDMARQKELIKSHMRK